MAHCPVTLSHLSTEYIHVSVSASDGASLLEPSDIDADLAFPRKGVQPASGDWKPATLTGRKGRFTAKVLVGPSGAAVLPAGVYDVWLRIIDAPESPVRKAGAIQIV